MRRAVAPGLLLLILLLAPGCRGRRPGSGPQAPGVGPAPDRPWWTGTVSQQERLRCLVARIPATSGSERVRLGREIVSNGEPAVPVLVEALAAPEDATRGTAAWLLGFLADPRAAEPLAAALADPVPLVRYEAAASLLRLQDERGLPAVIAGLEDADAMVRAKCILLLEQLTGDDLDYAPDLPPDERAAAVARWRAWAEERRRRG